MRLLCTLNDQKLALNFSNCLTREGIENRCETVANTDWGSVDYGNVTSTVWIIDEDQFDKASEWLKLLERDPKNGAFAPSAKPSIPVKTLIHNELKENPLKKIRLSKPKPITESRPLGVITFLALALCCIIFLIAEFTTPPYEPPPPGIPLTPLYSAPIKKELLFDYPKAFVIIDHIVNAYGREALEQPASLPREGQILLSIFEQTPWWPGIYSLVVSYVQNPQQAIPTDIPLFEKIKEGELWRLFSPAMLHNDLFHLFFNMIWLVVLGRQMEERMGKWRYVLFILLTGIASNVLQYLAGGANFIGFSGVLCAMLGYIWVRQQKAAWEGYQLLPSTMGFIMLFIFTMLGLQTFSFFREIYGEASISPGIANTAHLSGLGVGWFLGRVEWLSMHK